MSRLEYIDFLFFYKYCLPKLEEFSPTAPFDFISFFNLSEYYRFSFVDSF